MWERTDLVNRNGLKCKPKDTIKLSCNPRDSLLNGYLCENLIFDVQSSNVDVILREESSDFSSTSILDLEGSSVRPVCGRPIVIVFAMYVACYVKDGAL